jgi:hypothetical protein
MTQSEVSRANMNLTETTIGTATNAHESQLVSDPLQLTHEGPQIDGLSAAE